MNSPTSRQSRPLRTRVAKRNAPRVARTIALTRKGLELEGQPLPYFVGTDVEITHYRGTSRPLSIVNVAFFTERVIITDPPRGTTIETHYEG